MKSIKKITNQYDFKKATYLATIITLIVCSVAVVGQIKAQESYEAGEKLKNEIKKEAWEIGYFEGQNDGYKAKEEAYQEALLKTLAMHESRGGEKRKILDTNGKYSYGLYHFQADTVKDMYWRYYKVRITTERAIEIANDDELATELARHAIFVKNEKRHWTNSFLKMSLK